VREKRARVVVMDVTGVPNVDCQVANHLIRSVAAARLMGAQVIVTGLSAEVAQSLVTLGVDLSMLNTVGDLQGGLEEAERILGYETRRVTAARANS
jgi:rsbT co-antagonist protein RsbR